MLKCAVAAVLLALQCTSWTLASAQHTTTSGAVYKPARRRWAPRCWTTRATAHMFLVSPEPVLLMLECGHTRSACCS